jgi:hypothetical protein
MDVLAADCSSSLQPLLHSISSGPPATTLRALNCSSDSMAAVSAVLSQRLDFLDCLRDLDLSAPGYLEAARLKPQGATELGKLLKALTRLMSLDLHCCVV